MLFPDDPELENVMRSFADETDEHFIFPKKGGYDDLNRRTHNEKAKRISQLVKNDIRYRYQGIKLNRKE